MSRTPTLTPLDQRVLDALPRHNGQRAARTASLAHRRQRYEDSIGRDGTRRPVATVSREFAADVREILRGLEAIGLATQAGGWWKRT